MATKIRHVKGNTLNMSIVLTAQTFTSKDGTAQASVSDFTPDTGYPVVVTLYNEERTMRYNASVEGNVARICDAGSLPLGTYNLEVTCRNTDGEMCRYMERSAVDVVDATVLAGIAPGIEFDATTQSINAATVPLSVLGLPDNIVTDPDYNHTDANYTEEEKAKLATLDPLPENLVVDENYVHTDNNYTDEEKAKLQTLDPLPEHLVTDPNYVHTDNNYTDEDKEKVQYVDKLFGRITYNSATRFINFYAYSDTGLTTPLASIDTRPFLSDGMLNGVSVSADYIIFTFNADSNKSPIYLRKSLIFDSAKYYTREYLNQMFEDIYTKSQIDNLMSGVTDNVVFGIMENGSFVKFKKNQYGQWIGDIDQNITDDNIYVDFINCKIYVYRSGSMHPVGGEESDAGYLKYHLCADETEYNGIEDKDSGTLYLIPESDA